MQERHRWWRVGWPFIRPSNLPTGPIHSPIVSSFLPSFLPAGLANSKALDIDVGSDGKLVLASKAKKGLNKPSKLAHKTGLNKAPRCVRLTAGCSIRV
jgi:hypothetical protein